MATPTDAHPVPPPPSSPAGPPERATTASAPLFSASARHRVEVFSVVCGPIFTVCATVGWVILAQGLLPFDPSLSADALAAAYAEHHSGIVLGCTIMLIGCGFLTFWIAQLGVMLWTLEGRRPVLAITQMLGGLGVVAFVSSACCLWIGAAYRPDAAPGVVVALNDAGWFTFVLTWPGLSVQLVAAGLVVRAARDRPDRLAPGWVGTYCFVSAAVIALVALPAFTKTGPFAWNGVLGYYVPLIMWGISFEILSWSMLQTLRRRAAGGAEPAAAASVAAVAAGSAS
ncbi:hypothetical protein AB0L40_00275 [Patulibacter sp. NPDC049589]|uniref:hypothetical protein n=1 Tax=Patulibacter sp. NPDC049589 TaxID=3154731 RepID=UPI00342F0358